MKAAPWLFVLLWSGGFTAVAIALPYTEPLTLQVLRYAAVVLLLLPPVLLLRPAWPDARGLRHLARMGLVIQFSYFACTNLALSWGISPGGLALIVALQPILVALLSARVTGDVVPRAAWAGLLIAFCGVALVVVSGSAVAARDWPGLVFAVISLGAMTTGALLERRDGAPCHPLVSNLVLYTVGLAATLPVAWALEEMRVVWSANLAWGLGYLVLVNSLISMTLLLAMLRAGEAARVSALFFLVPPLAALLGWVVLGREVAPLAWLGTAIVALGVILARRGAAR
ncbi:DMT family transporter [Rhodovarius sp.]|jgi:drug/metabolite transporter (DMT)-like permease|uniref:DMT family transporter n=1 Tax=Rhodovarius sp. TaxID=2972673 RepID=UPI0034A0FC6C